uniref:DUF6462 family protein n=1 Tax=Enterocloster hominis (ex Hitch et al. 2024) TaxID=1917870 RepID=UPI00102F418D|nr:DUF6462 family protein [Lachnoclostridium pacaense]
MNEETKKDYGLKKFLTVKELQEYTGLGRNTSYKLAHESGAVIRIGRRLLVCREKIVEYLEANLE